MRPAELNVGLVIPTGLVIPVKEAPSQIPPPLTYLSLSPCPCPPPPPAGELLHVAEPFLEKNLHPTVIVRGFLRALEDGIKACGVGGGGAS